MAVDLNDPQAPVIILIGDGLDAGGFAGARVSVEQAVVGRPAADKGFRVLDQFPLGRLIADQVIQMDMQDIPYGQDHDLSVLLMDTKGLMQAESAYAVFSVEAGHRVHHLFRSGCPGQLLCQGADSVPDTAVIDPALFGARREGKDRIKFPDTQAQGQRPEVIVKQTAEDFKIMQGRHIDTGADRAPDLPGPAVAVLMIDQQVGQIAVPEAAVKTGFLRQLHQAVHDPVQPDPGLVRFLLLQLILPAGFHQPCGVPEYRFLLQAAV